MLRIAKIESRGGCLIVAQIQIDLDQLGERRVQYFTCGKNDMVLQINAHDSKAAMEKSSLGIKSRQNTTGPANEKFIKQRQQFLKRVSTGASRVEYQDQTRVKKSFSEKVYNLLREVKSMKSQEEAKTIRRAIETPQFQYNPYTSRQVDQKSRRYKLSVPQPRTLVKSYSENAIQARNKQAEDVKKKTQYERRTETNGSTFSKHRLMLNDLSVVACEQYFETVVQQPSEKPRTIGRNYLSPLA